MAGYVAMRLFGRNWHNLSRTASVKNEQLLGTTLAKCYSSAPGSREEIETHFIDVDSSRQIAYKYFEGASPQTSIETKIPNPGIIFCPGFQTTMSGVKAQALEEYCRQKQLSYVRFDYSGCGESSGNLEDVLFSDWKRDTMSILDQVTAGPQIIVGSNIGGWLALLAALERPHRINSIISIATAADFHQWIRQSYPAEVIQKMDREGLATYGSDHNTVLLSKKFFDDSEKHSLLKHDNIPITCPVRLMHGMQDKLVPFSLPVEIAERLWTRDVEVVLRKSADHRFSQPEEIQLLFEMLDYLVYGAEEARRLAVSSWQAFSVYSRPRQALSMIAPAQRSRLQ